MSLNVKKSESKTYKIFLSNFKLLLTNHLMRFFILALMLVVLFGCAAQQTVKKEDTVIKPATNQAETPVNQTPKNSEPVNVTYQPEVPTNVTNDSKKTNTSMQPEPDLSKYQLVVYYFYNPNCTACKAIAPEIDKLQSKYNGTVYFVKNSILEKSGMTEFNKFAAQYKLSNNNRVVPLIYVKDQVLAGRFDINASLDSLIQNNTK